MAKLSKDGLWEAILHPSAGISFGYEGWDLKMKDGTQYSGIISSKTETDIEIKMPGGLKKSDEDGGSGGYETDFSINDAGRTCKGFN